MGDQDLRDVALGGQPQPGRRVRCSGGPRSGNDRHVGAQTVLCLQRWTRSPTQSGAPSGRAASGSPSTPRAASRWCCPRRAAEREAAAAVRELRPVDRAPAGRAGARPRGGGRARRRRSPTSAGAAARARRAGTHARAPPRRRAAGPGGRGSASRRWSAGTGARRATRSPRGWTRACAQAGQRYTGLTIRGQRTRWASCSRDGRDELQLAAAAGARAGARLRRLARGLPPGGDGPLAALLGAARRALARTTASSSAGCAATAQTLVL